MLFCMNIVTGGVYGIIGEKSMQIDRFSFNSGYKITSIDINKLTVGMDETCIIVHLPMLLYYIGT